MDFHDQLTLIVKIVAPMILISSHAALRVRAVCRWISDQVGYGFYRWNLIGGMSPCSGASRSVEDV